ncbi:KH domain-containing protein [Baaleninema simplex]|uniref:KH domain-containing protein n=1 Tax=Baaleninema simplex TaxID=2862350 RepID=UPI000347B0EB|nr:KH domain-containing protein [Baaleninema simplex]
MSSSKLSLPATPNSPDFVGLVRFSIEPFLESPESLSVDCEYSSSKPQVWVRVAFDEGDRGRVFGRGGRNITAIHNTLSAIAKTAGRSLVLDVFGGAEFHREPDSPKPRNGGSVDRHPRSQRSPRRRPRSPRLNSQNSQDS